MEAATDPRDDLIRPFQIDPFALRGRMVRIGGTLDRIIGQHGYPDAVAVMLGEAVALAAILAGALKYDGVFTLQTKGDGPISLIVADVTTAGAVRGYAQYDAERLARAIATPGPGGAPIGNSVPRLLGAGYLAFTVDQGEYTERYQGIVELVGRTLTECIHHYFRQSEQIEAGIRIAVEREPATGAWRAGGLMIQRLPAIGGKDSEGTDLVETRMSFGGEFAVEAQDEGWRDAMVLLGTAGATELTDPDLTSEALLFRLFHESGVRVYPPQPLMAQCRCSRDRIEFILGTLPVEDTSELEVDGKVVVTCEFCGTPYRFEPDEVAALHAERE
ncbi:MAG TPA: Hsp33 family molecular chaperone [Stellaceae bacterium]|nr:Hsp33 family molecular chaperone [Stellaceae bacterium]